jgi:large subunit ribosomal protein L23
MKNNLLIRPIVTEKSMRDASKNCFTFEVAKNAEKQAILLEVAKTFNVKPTGVKTITVKGKSRRAGKTRQLVFGQNWKKAIVSLPAGQKIDLFDVAEKGTKNA